MKIWNKSLLRKTLKIKNNIKKQKSNQSYPKKHQQNFKSKKQAGNALPLSFSLFLILPHFTVFVEITKVWTED